MTLTLAFKVTKVKCNHTNGLRIYAFLSMFYGNIWPNSAPLQDTKLLNLSDLDFDLSRSLEVKCDGVIGLLIHVYGFLLIYISNCMCNSHQLAVKATLNVFSYLLSLVPNFEKIESAPNDLEMIFIATRPKVLHIY